MNLQALKQMAQDTSSVTLRRVLLWALQEIERLQGELTESQRQEDFLAEQYEAVNAELSALYMDTTTIPHPLARKLEAAQARIKELGELCEVENES